MISEEQYREAVSRKDAAQKIIDEYFKDKDTHFKERMDAYKHVGRYFTDEELFYSRSALCPCGHGLAYPKDCGPDHYWDCSAILKGIHDKSVKHTDMLPFAFYDVKGERDGQSTRGVYRPKPE